MSIAPQQASEPADLKLEPFTTRPIPADFAVARYQITLEALETLHLPPFKGSALRGGFGHTFKKLVCPQPWVCDKKCNLGNACHYGYIFETTPPQDSEVLRNFSEIPRPFVIQHPTDLRTEIRPGQQLKFGLVLIGKGIRYLLSFIAVFRELGKVGLGRTQGQYRLLAVEAILADNKKIPIYDPADESILGMNSTIDQSVVASYALTLPADRLTIDFLAPTRIKYREQWMQEGPPFESLIQTLLGRISSLSYFHCGHLFVADFRGLIDRATRVQIVRSETHWEDWSRVSGRQNRRIEMGGLVGRVTYEGDMADYLPLLALGELVHVGKGTVFGNGQYRIL